MKTKSLLHFKIQANTAILPSYEKLSIKSSVELNLSAPQLAILIISRIKLSLKQLALQMMHLFSGAFAIALLVTNLFFTSSSFGQEAASATWALNSNFSSSVTGKVSANSMTYGAGITTYLISESLYTSPYNQSSLSNAIAGENYLQFAVSPAEGLNLYISSISFGRAVPVSAINEEAFINISVLFSTDPNFVSYYEIGSAKFSNPYIETTSFTVQNALIAIGNRQTGYIRIYGWNLTGNDYFNINNVVISGTTFAACDDPDVQATMQPFTSTGFTGTTVNWSRGDGNGVIVVGRLTSTVGVDPVNMVHYNMFYSPAHSAFGTGNTTGEGNYIVYIGTGTSVAVTNLMQATDYTFSVYEYNDLNYCNKTPGSSLSVSTLCPDPTITSFFPTSVCSERASTIIIDGSNFVSGGTSVTVNGISATPVTFINSNRITVPLPAEVSGTGNITVTTCSTVTSGSTFTVNVSPATLTGALGADRCGTGSVTISVADPGTDLTVDWYANPEGGPVLSGGSGTLSFTTPDITNTTTYYAKTRNTASGCVSSERTAVIATIKTTPTAGTISGPSSVCFGSAGISYSATGIDNATSYTWAYSGTGATINGTTNPVTIDFTSGATPGNLTVRGNSECGEGTVSADYPIAFFSGPPATGVTICRDAVSSPLSAECTEMVYWYTQSSGGHLVESASSFDPVGDDEVIAQGGIYANLTNTGTPGTYPFFAECQANPGCRTAVDFVILPVAVPDVTGFNIANVVSPVLSGSPVTLTINSPNMIDGTYIVNYDLTGANTAANVSASVEIVSHSGNFTISNLPNSGSTTITITSIKNASDCSSAITSNNLKVIVVGPSTSTTNYSSGFFYVPEGIFSITVETWGGGGAGGGNIYENNGGGGGGGGAYSSSLLAVTPGTKYSVIVGEAGTGTPGGSGGNGRESFFAEYDPFSILVLANGGTGGHAASYDIGGSGGLGGVLSDKGTTKYAGGNGGHGRTSSIGRGGGGGSSAGTNANGTAGENGISSNVGGTAPDGGGDGGDGGILSANGQSGMQPGGGGGGSGEEISTTQSSTGGNGAKGQVKITWLCPQATISYSSTYFYSSESLAAVTLTGSAGGTFSATPAGLSINDLTGEINPSSSNAGIYTIHYQIPAAGDCAPMDATAEITIITPPTGPASITYCASEEKTVNDLTSLITGSEIKWYSSATEGSQFSGTEMLVSGSYFASQTVRGIESNARSEVAVVVNPRPATPTISTNISPIICKGGSVILTCTESTGYIWSTGAITSSISVGITGDYSVQVTDENGCLSLPSSIQHVDADHDIPAAAVTPNPVNGAPNICYSGEGAVSSLSWEVVPTATSYDVYFGEGSLPAVITQNVTANSYSVTLSANKTYFWKIIPRNNCGVAASAATWTLTTNNEACYCTPYSPNYNGGIYNVEFNTIDEDGLFNRGYVDLTDFVSAQTSVVRGSTYDLTVYADTDPVIVGLWSIFFQQAWIDWNQDGIFSQVSEVYALGVAENWGYDLNQQKYKKSSLCPFAITVPENALLGKTRMRVSSSQMEYATACGPIRIKGTYLDFGINVLPCEQAVFTAHPSAAAQTVCVGGNTTTLSVTATGTALTYQWYKNSTASNTGGTAITGAISTNYTPLSTSSGTFYYYCVASGQCSQPTPSNVSGAITVTAPPVAGPIIGDHVLYLGYTRKLTLSEAADEEGTWTSSNTDIVSVDASSGLVTGRSLGTATISYTVTGLGGCDNAKTEFQVTVSEPTYSCFGASDAVYGYNDPNGDMSPENAVGYPDNNYAAIGQNEYIALDLTGGNLSLGNTVTITWSKWEGEAFAPDAYLYESQDGVNWQFIKHDNVYHTSFTEYSIPVNISTRYLKIENRTAYWLYIKSVTYNYPCSGCLDGTLTLTTDNKDQIICPNSAINNIVYSVGGGATGATVSGLPNGINGLYSNEKVIISGSTSVIGTYNYTVATTGTQSGCTNVTVNGAITILSEVPDANFASTSSNSPVCSGDNAEFYLTGTANATVAFSLDGGTTTETVSLDGSGLATVIVPGVTENQEMSLISVYVGSCSKTLEESATVIVKPLPVVSILSNTLMEVGGTTTLSPASGGPWTSSNNAVAAVTPAGVVTGISVGTAAFTFTDAETGCSATTAKVTVSTNVCTGYAVDYFEEFGIVESSYFAIKNPDGQVASISYESNLILDLTGGNNAVFSPLALTMFVSEGDNPYVRISESSDRMNWTPVFSDNISNAEPLNYSLTVSEDARYIQIENTISNPEVWVYIDGISYNYPCAGCTPPSITGQPSPATQILCKDGLATTLSVTANGTGLSYQWYSNTSASTSGGTKVGTNSSSYTPLCTMPGTFYYYCEVSNACPPSAKSNVSGAVTVNPNPTLTSVTASVWGVCVGGSVVFTANGLLDGPTDFVYSVTYDDNVDGTPNNVTSETVHKDVSGGVATFTIDATAIGAYFFEIKSATINGCKTDFINVDNSDYFIAYTQPSVVLVATDNITTICSGTETVLTAYPDGGVGINHISIQKLVAGDWIKILESEEYYSIMVSPTETTTYRAVYKMDGNGCNDAISDELTITVNPVPSCSIVGEDGPVCVLRSLDYSAPEGMTTYKWSVTGNARIISSDEIRTITVRTGELDFACGTAFTLTLNITDANGCTSTCTKTVAGSTPQPVDVTGPASVSYKTCEFANQEALNTVYQAWEDQFRVVQAGCDGNTTDLSLFYPPDIITGHTNVIDFTLSDGCTSDSYSAIFTVEPATAPSIDYITATANQICSNGQTTLVAYGVGGTDVTLTWYTGSNGTGTNLGTGSSKTVTGPGTYYGRVTGYCNPAEASITIDEIPLSAVGSVTGTSQLCVGATATYTANGVVIGGGTGTWTSGDENVATVSQSGLVTAIGAGTATIFYSITGGCNNVSTQQDVTVNAAPTFTACPGNITQNTDANVCIAVVNYTATASGTPAPTVTYAFTGSNPPSPSSGSGNGSGATFNKGVTTVTITASNGCAPNAICSFTVTVVDDQAPVIAEVANISQTADPGKCYTIVTVTPPDVADNCDQNIIPISNFELVTNGNFNSGVSRWQEAINTAEVKTEEFYIVPLPGPSSNHVAEIDGSVSLGQNISGFIVGEEYILTFKATRRQNTSTPNPVGAVVTIDGSALSQVVQRTNLIFNLTTTSYTFTATQPTHKLTFTPHNNNTGTLGIIIDDISITKRRYPVGTTIIIWTATDEAGNATVAKTQTVTVSDNEIPVVNVPTPTVSYTADLHECNAALTFAAAPTDNCGVLSTVYSVDGTAITFPYDFPVGSTTVNVLVTDIHTNTNTGSFTVVVTDNESPTITAQAVTANSNDDGTGNCTTTVVLGTPTTVDNCGVRFTIATVGGSIIIPATYLFPVGQTTVTWVVWDIHNNKNSCTQVVTVIDNELPTFTCPANINPATDPGLCSAVLTLDPPSALDNCDPNVIVVNSFSNNLVQNGDFNSGASHWQDCGNIAESNTEEYYIVPLPPVSTNHVAEIDDGVNLCQNISGFTVGKEYILTFKATRRQNVSTPNPVSAVVTIDGGALSKVVTRTNTTFNLTPVAFKFTATKTAHQLKFTPYSDNRSSLGFIVDDIAVTQVNAPSTTYPIGETQVVWTAIDMHGNSSSCTQTVTVNDNEKPVITSNGNKNVNNDAGLCNAVVTVSASAIDNCGVGTPTGVRNDNKPLTDPYPVGTTTITWNVTDIHTNAAIEKTQTVTVTDNEKPVVLTRSITVQLDASGNARITPDMIDNGSTDNCGIDSYVLDISNFDCSNVVTPVTVTLSVVDKNRNVDRKTALVTVEDLVKPAVTCVPNISKYVDPYQTFYTVLGTEFDATATDACEIQSLTYACATASATSGTSLAGVQLLGVKAHSIVWTAVDNNGNQSTCTTVVTVAKRPTTLTYNGDLNEQYSDVTNLSAMLVDISGGLPVVGVYGKTITFIIGTQTATGITDVNGKATATLIITQSPVPSYKVVSTFAGDASYEPSSDEDDFDITQENAEVDYIGAEIVGEANPDVNVTPVQLIATITDTYLDDSHRGDIRNAKVMFLLNGTTPLSSWLTPTLVSPADLTQGIVSYMWNAPVPSVGYTTYDITIKVGTQEPNEEDGYYKGSLDQVPVNVYRTSLNEFITGAGHIIPVDSKGEYASDPGRKVNFGFNVKWNKTMKNLQGNFNLILRRGSEIYQIKSNALSSLGIDGTNPCSHKAVFTAKANLNRVTGGITENIMGNLSLQLTITDNGEPGVTDMIGITLYNGSTLIYSSSWPLSSTEELTLISGNLLIHDGLICNASDITHTVITSGKNPSLTDEDVTFTATVYGHDAVPQGNLVFMINGETFAGTLDSKGSASVDYSFDDAGSYEVEANYTSTNGYKLSTGSITQLVNGTNFVLSSSKNPSVVGDAVTFTAKLIGTGDAPDGKVTFKDDGLVIETVSLDGDGQAKTIVRNLDFGPNSITVEFEGNYDVEPTSLNQVVSNVSISLASSKNPSALTETVTFTASVTGSTSVGETVNFSIGGNTLSGVVDVSGTATVTTSFGASGTYLITATLAGTSISASLNQVVQQPTLVLTSSKNPSAAGESITFTATVNGGVGGNVTFTSGSSSVSQPVLGGVATWTTSFTAGSYLVTASYIGTTGSLTQVVNTTAPPLSVTLTASKTATSVVYGTNITFTAIVNNSATAPSGTITFKDNNNILKVVTVSGGKASFSTNKLVVGEHSITATYDLTKTVSIETIILSVTAKTKSAEIATVTEPEFGYTDLKVYPNPFSERLYFEFVSHVDAEVRIDVCDPTGRLIKTVFNSWVQRGVRYNTEFVPNNVVSEMYFYRMFIGKSVLNGKVIYKK